LQSENRSLQASNAKLKTALQKQESYQITVKADFNKLLENKLQEVKSQYNNQLKEIKSQYDAQLKDLESKGQSLEDQINSVLSSQKIRNEALSNDISVIREQVRGLTTLLGNLVTTLQLQDVNAWQNALWNHGLGRRLGQWATSKRTTKVFAQAVRTRTAMVFP
jgi:DNA anti-recombination protein RmuC